MYTRGLSGGRRLKVRFEQGKTPVQLVRCEMDASIPTLFTHLLFRCSYMARLLVSSILQLRLVYRAQFHHLTLAEWARLEAINHEAMRAITGLPRITPLTVLQQEPQLNTIDELVHQRRWARNLKPSTFCSAAALARYMGQEVHHSPSETSAIAPWNKMQLTENKPLGRLYSPVPRQANAQVSRLLRADNQDTATLVAYTDASVSGTTIHTALVCPSIPEACQTCSYFADPAPPAHLAELAAIYVTDWQH
ncbi:hypothetical protein HPB52_011117 [Rhipicephalus sanguineus]|uniref:Uncharacterized protein n=1 Tax=Rhipicephalus sanguineus TaxID=34632 RepID=A0A9D4T9L2_RHISA|nr:hypothetical protein HPB52_011117 [Rhipicephalus sanguineus]